MSQSIRDKWCEREISDLDYIRHLEANLKEPKTCEWKYYSDEFGGTYSTGCGDMFSITEGTPSENNMKYCHYCGAIIIEPKEQQ